MITYESIAVDLPEFESLKKGQQSFVLEFVADPKRNAARAFRIAFGIKEGDKNFEAARIRASQLLTKSNIQAAVKALESRIRNETWLLPRLVAVLEAVAFTDLRDVITWDKDGKIQFKSSDELTPQAAAALSNIQEIVEVKQPFLFDELKKTEAEKIARRSVKMHPKMEAIRLLAQLTGIGAAQRVEVTGFGDSIKEAWARLESKGDDHAGAA